MKTALTALFLALAVTINAQVVTLSEQPQTAAESPNQPPNLTLLAQQVAKLVDELKPNIPVHDDNARDARIHELERMILAVNAKLAAATNGVTAQTVKEAVIAAAPPQYKDLMTTISELVMSLFVLCRYLYAWKNGSGHTDALKAVFCGTNTPPVAPRAPVNTTP